MHKQEKEIIVRTSAIPIGDNSASEQLSYDVFTAFPILPRYLEKSALSEVILEDKELGSLFRPSEKSRINKKTHIAITIIMLVLLGLLMHAREWEVIKPFKSAPPAAPWYKFW